MKIYDIITDYFPVLITKKAVTKFLVDSNEINECLVEVLCKPYYLQEYFKLIIQKLKEEDENIESL